MSEPLFDTPDEIIIGLLVKRDETALKEIEQRYGKYIYSIASNFLSSDDDITDCVSDTYFKIWKRIPPEIPDDFKCYIAKTARNAAIGSSGRSNGG